MPRLDAESIEGKPELATRLRKRYTARSLRRGSSVNKNERLFPNKEMKTPSIAWFGTKKINVFEMRYKIVHCLAAPRI